MTASKKTDNHDPSAKLCLRHYFMRKYHRDGSARVLDCCMGSGFLWRELRRSHQVKEYLGLDVKPKKGRLKIDSARYLEAGGWAHDVIDIDSYGSPWRHWFGVLRFSPDVCTCFLTIGLVRMAGGGAMQDEAKRAMGIAGMQVPQGIVGSLHGISFRYCLAACTDYGMEITEALEAESKGNARYIGIRLKRVARQEVI